MGDDPNIAAKRQRTSKSQRSPTRRNNSQCIPTEEVRAHSIYIPTIIDFWFIELALNSVFQGADVVESIRATSNHYLHRVAATLVDQVYLIASQSLAITSDRIRAYGIRAQLAAKLL